MLCETTLIYRGKTDPVVTVSWKRSWIFNLVLIRGVESLGLRGHTYTSNQRPCIYSPTDFLSFFCRTFPNIPFITISAFRAPCHLITLIKRHDCDRVHNLHETLTVSSRLLIKNKFLRVKTFFEKILENTSYKNWKRNSIKSIWIDQTKWWFLGHFSREAWLSNSGISIHWNQIPSKYNFWSPSYIFLDSSHFVGEGM